jgi:TPR repeat protein
MHLVFREEPPKLASMDKSFFRRWFNSAPPALPQLTRDVEDGNAEVQFHLGLKHANGQGSAQDYKQAAEWYLKAAAQNHALAEFNLGMMHAAGQGFPKDTVEADVWFGKSAHHGDAGAQYQLGMRHYRKGMHSVSEDVTETRIEAYKWLALSAAQGYGSSQSSRDEIVVRMTRDEVTEGNLRVANFTT